MNISIAFVVGAVVVLAMTVVRTMRRRKKASGGGMDIWPKVIFSEKKKEMYMRLMEAFPERIILFHVSYAMMLKAKSRDARSMVEGMIADFVVLSENFTPMMVIDLDETGGRPRFHGREEVLLKAGYPHLRYSRIPGIDELRNDVHTLESP